MSSNEELKRVALAEAAEAFKNVSLPMFDEKRLDVIALSKNPANIIGRKFIFIPEQNSEYTGDLNNFFGEILGFSIANKNEVCLSIGDQQVKESGSNFTMKIAYIDVELDSASFTYFNQRGTPNRKRGALIIL